MNDPQNQEIPSGNAYNHSRTVNDTNITNGMVFGNWQGFNFIEPTLEALKKRSISFVIDSKATTASIMTKINSAFGSALQDLHINDVGARYNGY